MSLRDHRARDIGNPLVWLAGALAITGAWVIVFYIIFSVIGQYLKHGRVI